jgi:hypothetical protein
MTQPMKRKAEGRKKGEGNILEDQDLRELSNLKEVCHDPDSPPQPAELLSSLKAI